MTKCRQKWKMKSRQISRAKYQRREGSQYHLASSRLLSFPINVKLDLNSTVSQIFSLKLGYEVRKIREDNNVLESKFK